MKQQKEFKFYNLSKYVKTVVTMMSAVIINIQELVDKALKRLVVLLLVLLPTTAFSYS